MPKIFRMTSGGKLTEGLFKGETINTPCLLYTSDAADERSSVDLGGRRIIKKKNRIREQMRSQHDKHIYKKDAVAQ